MRARLRSRISGVLALALLAIAAVLWAHVRAGDQGRPLSIAQLRTAALRDPSAWGGRTVRVRATAFIVTFGRIPRPPACGRVEVGQGLADGPDPGLGSPFIPLVGRNDSLWDALRPLPWLGVLVPSPRLLRTDRPGVYSVHVVAQKCDDGWKVYAEMQDVLIIQNFGP